MPRMKKPEVTITVADETWPLVPPSGTKAFVVVPRLISLVSEAIAAAGRANINLRTLINEDGFNFASITAENLLAFKYIADMLVDRWDSIVSDIFPVLLSRDDQAWFESNGTPFEYFAAISTALNFNAPFIFGDKAWSALKKSLTVEETNPEEESQETD